MTRPIVRSDRPVALVGGGEATVEDVSEMLLLAPRLVAADGGAGLALRAGVVPEAVIGDFDSLLETDRTRIAPERLHFIDDQDTTDFDKALGRIAAPLVLAAGFLGKRLDHQLAAFSTLLRFPDRPCVLIGAGELVFLAPPVLELDLPAMSVVSLYPSGEVRGRSQGLEWPIDGLVLSPGGRIGTSNRALGALRLEVDVPGLLVIVPRTALEAVTRALAPSVQALPPRWPVRA